MNEPVDKEKNQAKKKITNTVIIAAVGALIPIIFIVIIMTSVAYALGIINNNNNITSDGENGEIAGDYGKECGFTIKSTPLSKSEYRQKIENYAKTHNNAKLFAKHADTIYDLALKYGINPELVIIRAASEGYSPGNKHPSYNNYWGLGCTNTGGLSACKKYSSFISGVEAFLKNISKYDSLMSMMSRYANIGKYWYNPGAWDLGGCIYAKYIYPSNMPTRVSSACASNKKCSGSNCVATTAEDQQAYARWQVESKMSGFRQSIFGLSGKTICTNTDTDTENNNASGSGNNGNSGNNNQNANPNPSLGLFITNGSQLKSNLATFLSQHGTNISNYNKYIYKNVRQAGVGTRAGVVNAALSFFKYLDQYGYRPRYTYGGVRSSIYGVPSSLGSTSFDCSGFISWAIHNGGYKYFSKTSGNWGTTGSKCNRTSSSCIGKPGDLIWHSGHIMMIVGVEGSNYYIAEAASTNSGMRIKKEAMHKNSADRIVNMTNFYNNQNNKSTASYPS